MEMKKVLFCIGCLLLISCKTQIVSNQLPQGEVPYQRYIADENTEVLLYIYDNWGIQNDIFVKKGDSLYCAGFEIDPIPIVKMVRHDTIFLEYHNYTNQGDGVVCRQSIYDWARNVGPYTIIRCRHYDLTGSGLFECGSVDSVSTAEREVTLYNHGDSLFRASVNDLVSKKGPDGKYYIYFSEIDSISGFEKSYRYSADRRIVFTYMIPK